MFEKKIKTNKVDFVYLAVFLFLGFLSLSVAIPVSAATCASLGGTCKSSGYTVDLIKDASDCGWFSACYKSTPTPSGGSCTGTGQNAGKTGRCGTYCGSSIIDDVRCTTANGPAMGGLFCCIGQTADAPAAGTSNANTAVDNNSVPGTTEAGGIIKCGRGGQEMCTLCDLIAGLNTIIKYIMGISVVLALAMFTIGGGMYVVSVGDKGMIDLAKGAMKNAVIGFAVIFSAWLIINTLLYAIGTSSNLGINGVGSWWNFQCIAR